MAVNLWNHAKNVLCVRLDAMGDVLMTTPAIRALKESSPGRKITLLTSRSGAKVAPLIPEVDDFFVYEAPWMKATPQGANSRHDCALARFIKSKKYDSAVIFTIYSQSSLPAALLCYMADIPLRLAYCHQNPYQLLTHWVADPEPKEMIRHEVRRHLDLVGTINCATANEQLSLNVPSKTRKQVISLVEALGIDFAKPWLVLHPGATAPSRRYPPEGFAEAARRLSLDHGFQILFTGTPHEEEIVLKIQQEMQATSYSLAGKLDLKQLSALISLAPLLIVNNTGPAHIAAAVGTPVVDLYALTNPQHTPWSVPSRVLYHDVPCKFCYKSICPQEHHNCLRGVSPLEIVKAALELFGFTPSPSTKLSYDLLHKLL